MAHTVLCFMLFLSDPWSYTGHETRASFIFGSSFHPIECLCTEDTWPFSLFRVKKTTAWSSGFLKIFMTCAKTRISKFHAPLLQCGGAKCFLKTLIAINTAQEVRWLHDSQPFRGLLLQLCCQSPTMTFNESPAVYITVYIFRIPQVSPLNDL